MVSKVRKPGFTLVELLVVITIIGILIALLLPAVQAAREAARRSQCVNNLKQMGLGLHNFHDSFGKFPVGQYDDDNNNWGWMVWILPYMEQRAIYDQLTTAATNPVWVPPNQGGGPNGVNVDTLGARHDVNDTVAANIARSTINAYVCPTDILPKQATGGTTQQWYGKSNYCANMGSVQRWATTPPTAWPYNYTCGGPKGSTQDGVFMMANDNSNTWSVTIAEILDGTSNTVAVGEVSISASVHAANVGDGAFPIWAGGNPLGRGCGDLQGIGSTFRLMDVDFFINRRTAQQSDVSFGSLHPGGANFLLCDGSVRFISETVDTILYRALGTRRGNETVQVP